MTALEQTLEERGSRYGKFQDQALICQTLKLFVRTTAGWSKLHEDQKQAIETIFDKIARILNGDPNYIDNWHDIQGYAKLVEDRLLEAQKCRLLREQKK